MDYAIQKATELGVHKIQLLTSERCEMRLKYDRDQKKIDHWQAIAIAACEQCGLNIVPEVLAPISLQEWFSLSLPATKLVLAPDTDAFDIAKQATPDLALLIGPEGGFIPYEVELLEKNGCQSFSLGNRILRTETAISYILGRLGI